MKSPGVTCPTLLDSTASLLYPPFRPVHEKEMSAQANACSTFLVQAPSTEGGKSMFSKLTALTVASLTLASPFVVPATAHAQPGVIVVAPVEHHWHFMVEYRLPRHRHWRTFAAY